MTNIRYAHSVIFGHMRFWGCPELTSSPTSCDIHPSRIAFTQWIAFLTLVTTLRTDRSLLSTLDSRFQFPPLLWIPFPWPSGYPVISAEMARYKVERKEKTEQGWGQHHLCFHLTIAFNDWANFYTGRGGNWSWWWMWHLSFRKSFFQVQSYVVGFLSLFGISSLPPVPLFHWPFSVWRCSVFSSQSPLYLANLIQSDTSVTERRRQNKVEDSILLFKDDNLHRQDQINDCHFSENLYFWVVFGIFL